MKEFAKGFYNTALWQKTREQYMKFRGGLCERCLQNGIIRPGEIVHHKTYLTKDNIMNPDVALSFANLELLCRQCHADEHDHNERKRYEIGEDGSVVTGFSRRDAPFSMIE